MGSTQLIKEQYQCPKRRPGCLNMGGKAKQPEEVEEVRVLCWPLWWLKGDLELKPFQYGEEARSL